MTEIIWFAVFLQVAMGGFDTLYHHELTERLAWRVTQASELRLHGVRNFAYAVMFTALGWSAPHGAVSIAFMLLLFAELIVTLWDFVEEDRSRRLPASERINHTLLTFNYGIVLAMLAPVLWGWAGLPTGILFVYHGVWSWLCAIAALGVVVSGARDLAAARRVGRIKPCDPAPLGRALHRRHSVLVTGGTGFVGARLVAALAANGNDVTVLTRDAGKAVGLPAPHRVITSLDQIADNTRIDAIVNLAGEPIADGVWTARKRRRILRSRLEVTRQVIGLIARLDTAPSVLVNGSAIGWYGMRGDEVLDESASGEDCFSRRLCVALEAVAMRAEALGTRVVTLRIGLVLGAEGGMLSRLLAPFEFGLGGPIGDGRQWMSWIHRDDLVRLIVHAVAKLDVYGPVNATAPVPVTNADFAAALGQALGRPAGLRVPAWPLRRALGGFAEELLLSGQRVVPKAALESGFGFEYPWIDEALGAIVGRAPGSGRPLVVAPGRGGGRIDGLRKGSAHPTGPMG